MLKKYQRILVFDFETSGLYANSDQIIEVGAILFSNTDLGLEVLKEESFLVKTDNPLPEKITEITGITDDDLNKYGVTKEEAFNRILDLYSEKTLLVAYNIQFDLSFLDALFKNHYGPEINNDILDVLAIYRDRHVFPHKLLNAIDKYAVALSNTHRALDDTKATIAVLKKMADEKPNIEVYVNKIGYNARYGVSGLKLKHVTYIAQAGGKKEIESDNK